MNDPTILTLARLPARLDTRQAAEFLGLQQHDIAILIASHLLKPIGEPRANAPKFFASIDLEELAQDRTWLNKAQLAIQKHWKLRNSGELAGQTSRDARSDRHAAGSRNRLRTTTLGTDTNQPGTP